jgi:hypothetical protein
MTWYRAHVWVLLTPKNQAGPEPPQTLDLIAGVYPVELWARYAAQKLFRSIPKLYQGGWSVDPINKQEVPYPYPIP